MLDVSKIVDEFCKEKPRRKVWGYYRIVENGSKLIYKTKEGEEDVIAIKLPNGSKLANTSTLPLIGRRSAWGRVIHNRFQTEIQRKLVERTDFFSIPFTVFTELNLDLMKFESVEKAAEENVVVKGQRYYDYQEGVHKYKEDETRHFTGASLFKVEDAHYLFDIDRVEIANKIFNPFLAKLPKPVKTIKEAYESLKPKEVVAAEKKGLKVLRQGEWFFIPAKKPKLKKPTEKDFYALLNSRHTFDPIKRGLPSQISLRAGNSRPNNVSSGIIQGKKTYCSGVVSHQGREHKDLNLKDKWYLAVPNTSVGNFTISGDVD